MKTTRLKIDTENYSVDTDQTILTIKEPIDGIGYLKIDLPIPKSTGVTRC